ncbi:hypothetical protein ACFX13_014189 [Malus domestica]
MEAKSSKRRLRAPNPLSDYTNTISSTTTLASATSSQSSSSSTVKLKYHNPKLASVIDYLISALNPKPSVVPPLIPSIPPCPHPVSSSASGNFSAPLSISPFLALDGQFMVVAEPADFVHIYSTQAYYKVRQEIDFFGEISVVLDQIIPVVYIYEFDPWKLPQVAGEVSHGDSEQWFFFIPRPESEARGGRPRRLTTIGYWKASGSPSTVYSSNSNYNRPIGHKRTMGFYIGRAPRGKKTEWMMNEYKAIEAHADHNNQLSMAASSSIPRTSTPSAPTLRQEFSLCRVHRKSKSLWAYDRRHPGIEITRNPGLNIQAAPAQGANHLNQCSTTSNRNPQNMGERTNLSSLESSSSGGHASQSSQPEQSGILPMAVDDEAIWDWDELMDNWL